jgi:hypothetical protein
MILPLDNLDLPLLMDILALGASAVLIGFLFLNRRRYGSLLATAKTKPANFSSEIALQMLTQQSQRSYARIQETINQEFTNWQRMTSGRDFDRTVARNVPDRGANDPTATGSGGSGSRFYDEAARMVRNGASPQEISLRCGLSRGEIDLIAYMQKKSS